MFIVVKIIPIIKILSYAERLFKIFFITNSRAQATTEHKHIKNIIPNTESCSWIYMLSEVEYKYRHDTSS